MVKFACIWNIRRRKQVVWRCSTRMLQGPTACDAATIAEDDLQQVTVEAINKLLKISPTVRGVLLENIKAAIADDNSSELERVNQQLADKQSQLVKLAHAKKDYSLIADEIYSLREQRQQILNDNAKKEVFKNRIAELEQYLSQFEGQIIEYDEKLVRRYIENIMVYDDRFVVKFKAGVEIEIKGNDISPGV